MVAVWESSVSAGTLVPQAIRRFIEKHTPAKSGTIPKIDTIEKRIDAICQRFKDDVVDLTSEAIFQRKRAQGLRKANQEARKLITLAWKSRTGRLTLVPGKKVISELSNWSKRNYGVSFGALSIAREIRVDELDPEIVATISAIETGSTI